MELQQYLAILKRRIWIVAGCSLLLIILVFIGSRIISPRYAATTSLRILTPRSGGTTYVDFNIYYATRLMNTYANLASAPSVAEGLQEKLKLKDKPKIDVAVVADSELLKITAEEKDPALSAVIANSVAEMLLEVSRASSLDAKTVTGQAINDRLTQLDAELAKVRNTYADLIVPYNQDLSQISSLQAQIEYDQQVYLSLKTLYEQSLQGVRTDPAALNSLMTQITFLEEKMAKQQAEIDDITTKSTSASVKIAAAQGDIILKEQEYSTLVIQLDQLQALQLMQGSTQLAIVERAIPPVKPSSPNYLLVYVIGIIISIFLAVVAAFVYDVLDDTLSSPEKMKNVLSGVEIGTVTIPSNRFIKFSHNHTEGKVSDISIIQHRLARIAVQQGLKSFVFCCPDTRCDLAPILAELGILFAKGGEKVVLVDADQYKQSLQQQFPETIKENEAMRFHQNGTLLKKILRKTRIDNLFLIPANEAGFFSHYQRLESFVNELEQTYDKVIIQIPSLLLSSELDELISYVDGMIIVIDQGKTKEKEAQIMLHDLHELNIPVIGYIARA